MAPSEDPDGNSDRRERALETHSIQTVRFLVLAKEELDDSAYKQLVKAAGEIVKRSENPDGGITVEECEEILSEVFAGRTRLLNSFHHFLQAGDPFHDEKPYDPVSFLKKVKASPYISDEDYNDLLTTIYQFSTIRTMTVEDVYEKAKRIMRQCPEFIEIFQTYLPPHLRGPLPVEQPYGSPKPSPGGKALFTVDANYGSQVECPCDQNHEGVDYPFGLKHTQWIPRSFQMSTDKGVSACSCVCWEHRKCL